MIYKKEYVHILHILPISYSNKSLMSHPRMSDIR